MTTVEFAVAVLAYCEATSASETSGYRTAKHNAAVGGVMASQHLVGLARDVVYDDPLALEERRRIAASFGLRVWPEGDHDHLSPLAREEG